jgi:hypothetical protein
VETTLSTCGRTEQGLAVSTARSISPNTNTALRIAKKRIMTDKFALVEASG